jgi:hypothetical protein
VTGTGTGIGTAIACGGMPYTTGTHIGGGLQLHRV